jgi:Holliday junction resolvase RusA-like endonuclease
MYQKIVLINERPQSWNVLKRLHWRKWQNEVERCKWLILEAVGFDSQPVNGRVRITVTAYYKNRPHDASNIPLKLYEDGLVAAGVLTDDSPVFVDETVTRSRVDKQRPRVEIEIETVGFIMAID